MKNKKMIEMFETIPKQKTISSYSITLNKLFKQRNLNEFVDNLKNPPKIQQKSFLEKFNQKYPKKTQKFSEKILNSTLKKPKIKVESLRMKQWKAIANLSLSRVQKNRQRNIDKETPDSFRYTPNYNSIYKKSPCAVIGRASMTIDTNISSTLPAIQEIKMKHDSIASNETFSTTSYMTKNNHSLRFSDYSSRKGIIGHKTFISDSIDTIERSTCSLKKKSSVNAPDFSKMLKREENSLIYKYSLNVPASVCYHPNHDYIRERAPEVTFSRDKPKPSRKYLIRKLWSTYDVTGEYHLVNF